MFERGIQSLTTLWRSAPLPAAARHLLFRQGRLLAAAVALGCAAPLAFLSGSPAMAVAMLLAGLLPAAVALDCRCPSGLGRAAMATLLVLGATLSGGVLRGLPADIALFVLAVVSAEALVVAGRRERAIVAGIIPAAFGLLVVAAQFAPPVMGGMSVWLAAASLLVANVIALGLGLAAIVRRRNRAHRRQLRMLRRGAFLLSETVILLDRTGCVLQVGRNARASLGLSRESLLGRGLNELTLVSDRPLLLTACANGLAATPSCIRFRLKAGVAAAEPHYRWVELKIPAGPAGKTMLASLRDVTEAVADEARSADIAAAATKAEAARSAFLSTVNHELRTPLNAIVGFSEFLANPVTTPSDAARVREYAGIIHEAGHDLLQKVSAMIDITRIQAGAYDFALETIDLGALVQSCIDSFRLDRGLEADAITHVSPASPVMAEIDARAFRGALTELLANAQKHGRGRTIRVALSDARGGATVTVRDSGPGVPADKLALLHRDLGRLDETLGRSHGGMGLGLTLARGLMRLHGGVVSIDVPDGPGLAVTLTLPAVHPVVADGGNVVTLAKARAAKPQTHPEGRKRRRA